MSGSSLATAATMGLIGLPEMRKRGYSTALASGAVAAGGTLGSLTPPSGALIVFGIIAEQSIGKLFTAAIIPALTQTLLYMATIVIVCRSAPPLRRPRRGCHGQSDGTAIFRVLDLAALVDLRAHRNCGGMVYADGGRVRRLAVGPRALRYSQAPELAIAG